MKDMDRFAYFNFLKFIGAFFISIFLHYNDHFLPGLGIENPWADNLLLWDISHNSYVFVGMYFIISGILFTVAYKDKIENGMPFDYFFTKRIIRIFPLVAFTSVICYMGGANSVCKWK